MKREARVWSGFSSNTEVFLLNAHLTISHQDHSDQHNVNVASQRLVVIDFINLWTQKRRI